MNFSPTPFWLLWTIKLVKFGLFEKNFLESGTFYIKNAKLSGNTAETWVQFAYSRFHIKGTCSVHLSNGDYVSIPEGTGSCWYLFHEIPDIWNTKDSVLTKLFHLLFARPTQILEFAPTLT